MRVLITGGDGFIGSHLADRLFGQERTSGSQHEKWIAPAPIIPGPGNIVACVDNWETGLQREMTYECDIADRERFYEFANRIKPQLVIHCAASYSDPNKWHRDTDTNISGTINAINVARHHGAKLVYFQTALPPISSYAISKIAGEQYIKISDVPSLIFRLANVYGPRNISGPIPAFYKRLAAGEPCTVVKTVRDMVYIDDLIECVMSALERDRVGTFDVCSGLPVSIRDLYDAVAINFEFGPKPEMIEPAGEDVMPSTSVHNWLEGWSPRTELREGVAHAVRWYREHGVEQTYTHLAMKG